MKSKPAILIYFSCLFAAALVFSFSGVALAEKKATPKNQTTGKAVKKDADFWFNKGALLSTYGNHKAAVQYFQKAISLNPNFSKAYFSQGVSYGQLGQYMALKQEPQNGLYYYGRGRVYLLWGDKAKAMDDFKKAAEFGDEDALNYLEYIGEGN
jgi:tetratricopeptide (TPR) repeat protein